MPLRCYCCGYKDIRREEVRIGDRCTNPYINNGCDGKLEIDLRPSEPGYITQSQEKNDGTRP